MHSHVHIRLMPGLQKLMLLESGHKLMREKKVVSGMLLRDIIATFQLSLLPSILSSIVWIILIGMSLMRAHYSVEMKTIAKYKPFYYPISARYFRIYPMKWMGRKISMRCGLVVATSQTSFGISTNESIFDRCKRIPNNWNPRRYSWER